MSRSSIGTVMLATIAGMLQVETTFIIAATVNTIIASNVLLTADAAMKPAVWVVQNNVHIVKIKSV